MYTHTYDVEFINYYLYLPFRSYATITSNASRLCTLLCFKNTCSGAVILCVFKYRPMFDPNRLLLDTLSSSALS